MPVKRYDDMMNAGDVSKFLSSTSKHKTKEKIGKDYYGQIWSNFTNQVVVKLERIKHFIKTLFTKGNSEWINNNFVADKIKELSNKIVELEKDIQGKDINKTANDITKLNALCSELNRTVEKDAKIGKEKKTVLDLQREMGAITKRFDSFSEQIAASKKQIVPPESGEASYAGINVVRVAEPATREVRTEGKRGQKLPIAEQEKPSARKKLDQNIKALQEQQDARRAAKKEKAAATKAEDLVQKPAEEPPPVAPKTASKKVKVKGPQVVDKTVIQRDVEAREPYRKKADELIARGTKLEDDEYYRFKEKTKLRYRGDSPFTSQEFVGKMKKIHERDAAIAKNKGKANLEKHEAGEVSLRHIEQPKPIEVTKEPEISRSEEREVSTEQLQETIVNPSKVSIDVIRDHIKHLLEKILENKGINKALGSAIWSEGSDITKLKGFKEKLYTPKSAIELDLNEIERLLKKAQSKDKDKTNDTFYVEALRGVEAIRDLLPRLAI